MPENATTARRYDAMPYDSHPFHETHPDHLACLATLFGIDPAPVAQGRVLEIGCAGGGNLIPMALGLPGARFVGIDLSPRQIADACATAEALGLDNIELRAMDLAELDEALGPFDTIIAHGVYSWVPEDVRDRLLDRVRALLAPNGVAFVSYNTLPGWHILGIVRDMIRFHAEEGPADPAEQVRAARAFLDLAVEVMPEPTTPYALAVRREVEQLRGRGDAYLLHEFLEPVSRPVYVREFVAHAAAHGLRYLTDARPRTTVANQPNDLRAAIDGLTDDPIRREQYLDLIRNRTFRRSVLVHETAGARAEPDPARLDGLRVAAAAGPSSPQPDIHSAAPEEFRSFDGTQWLATADPLVKAALVTVLESWPASLPVPELRRRVLARLDRPPTSAAAAPFDRDPAALNVALLQCHGLGLLDLRTIDPPVTRIPGARPAASPYARRQAEGSRLVTNLLHRAVELSEFDRLVLCQLDGTRARSEIVDALVAAAVSGRFPLTRDGQPITDAIEVRQVMDRSLDPALVRLLGSALLIEQSDQPDEPAVADDD